MPKKDNQKPKKTKNQPQLEAFFGSKRSAGKIVFLIALRVNSEFGYEHVPSIILDECGSIQSRPPSDESTEISTTCATATSIASGTATIAPARTSTSTTKRKIW